MAPAVKPRVQAAQELHWPAALADFQYLMGAREAMEAAVENQAPLPFEESLPPVLEEKLETPSSVTVTRSHGSLATTPPMSWAISPPDNASKYQKLAANF